MENEKLPLTVVILARNEADNIEQCIKTALFADEILVIENNSTDNTVELALFYSEILTAIMQLKETSVLKRQNMNGYLCSMLMRELLRN